MTPRFGKNRSRTLLLTALGGCCTLIQCSSSDDTNAPASGAGSGGTGASAGQIAAAGSAGKAMGGASGASGGQPAGGTESIAGGGNSGASGEAGAGGEPPITWGPDADYPYPSTNYDEPYRAQYHFTAPMGWINDANGMWFDGGLYHLAYQASPLTLQGEEAKFWGHATSTDLVHWTNWPIMLHPGINAGPAWSGSTVIDTANTSGFRTGAYPVVVTIYTDDSKGTSLAYSNDRGLTWKAYAGNPLSAVGGPNGGTRDPHVFWHEGTQQWVLALYENGITFYTSPDLKTWTKRSNNNFGFECPDIYQLPVDGSTSNQKWVLQDASGSYTLGQFDGTKFIYDHSDTQAADKPDAAYVFRINASSDFYASQTFNRASFPDTRVVQVAWIRGAGNTAPFNQALSFPAQLALRSFPEGLRVARTPIDEIKKLYTKTEHFAAQVASSGANLFQGTSGTNFDLEIVLDMKKTTAKSVTLTLGDATLVYDVAGGSMFGATVSPVADQVKLRVLRDWGQYEVYVNDGEVSFTKDFAFAPSKSSIGLTPDASGDVAIVSADLHTLGRAWPGTAALASTIIDDADAGVNYTGTWVVATEGRYFANGVHVATGKSATFQASFTGTRIDWWGLKNTDLGFADVYLDGVIAQAGIDAYDPVRQNALLFTRGKLTPGAHTIKIVTNGNKNPLSAGIALVHDYLISYQDQ